MGDSAIRVLLIDDDAMSYKEIASGLAKLPGSQLRLDWTGRYRQGLALAAGNSHDAYLVDFVLDEHDGLKLIREATEAGCRGAMVLLTSQDSDELDGETLKSGAAGFVLKQGLSCKRLERMIRYTMAHKRSEVALAAIAAGSLPGPGDEFFGGLAVTLAKVMGVSTVVVAEALDEPITRVRTVGYVRGGEIRENIEYGVADTPCEAVLGGETCYFGERLQARFPEDHYLKEIGAESYWGIPLVGDSGRVMGHLAVIDRERIEADGRAQSIFKILASRAGSELERRRAERELLHQKNLLQSILDSVADGVAVSDSEGRTLVFNPAAEEIMGKEAGGAPKEEWAGRFGLYRSDGVTPYPSEELPLARAIEGATIDEEELVTRTTGHPEGIYLRVSARPLRNERGETAGGVVIFRDVTEQRNAREALRLSEETFSKAFHSSPNPIVIGEIEDGAYVDVNEAFLQSIGMKREDVIGKRPLDLGLWKDSKERDGMIRKLKETGSVRNYEHHYQVPGLGEHVALLSAEIIELEGRKYVLTTANDITERMRAESRLRESEERFRRLVESANEAIVVAEAETGRILEANAKAEELIGLKREALLELTEADLHPPEQGERYRALFKKTVARGGGRETEAMHVWNRADGREIPVEISTSVSQVGGQRIVQGIYHDITERHEAAANEAKLFARIRQDHDDLLSILNQMKAGIAMTDERGCITFVNEAGRRLTRAEDLGTNGRTWQKTFGFQDRHRLKLEAMAGWPIEKRSRLLVPIEQSDGSERWVEVSVRDDPRNPERKIFILDDVTDAQNMKALLKERTQFGNLIGKSPAMKLIYDQIREVARVDSIVLIEGETGTGKELVARAIHETSHRRAKPFIAVNCAGLTESLLASQLFGHKRGAFTGAIENHRGHFEEAEGGTIFLDEIGDIPTRVQLSMLRVLQEFEIVRLGESRARKINVRILCATNRDLAVEVEHGRFRQDLLYRIRVARIHLPPLRERREDIPLLAGVTLQKFGASWGKTVAEISQEAMRAMLVHDWPGNVRELQGAIEFAAIRAKTEAIEVEDLPPELSKTRFYLPRGGGREESARESVLAALESAHGNRTTAARLLGISRATLYRRMTGLNIMSRK